MRKEGNENEDLTRPWAASGPANLPALFYLHSLPALFASTVYQHDLPTVFGDGKNFYSLIQELQNIRFPLEMIKSFYFFESGRWDLIMYDYKILNCLLITTFSVLIIL